jgi:NADPH:quinone reductase-like Zn-dependent oxidoreductase
MEIKADAPHLLSARPSASGVAFNPTDLENESAALTSIRRRVDAEKLAYMTAYQVLHSAAKAMSGETVLVHGAAGRVGVAALELGALAGLRLYGTASVRDRAKLEALGAVAIDYGNEDFLARVREEAGGVDVVVDSLGGLISLGSFRALRPGGRLVVFGRYDTLRDGHKDWPSVIKWYAAVAAVWLWDKLSPRRRVFAYHVQKYRDRATRRDGAVGGEPMDPDQFREDFGVLIEMLREGKIHPVVAERLPLAEARHAHEMLESAASKGKLVLVMAHRPFRRRHRLRAPLSAWDARPRDGLRDQGRSRPGDRLHAPALGRSATPDADRPGAPRACSDADGTSHPSRLRIDRSLDRTNLRRDECNRWPRCLQAEHSAGTGLQRGHDSGGLRHR